MTVVDIAPTLGAWISDVRIDRSGQEEFDEIMRVLLDGTLYLAVAKCS